MSDEDNFCPVYLCEGAMQTKGVEEGRWCDTCGYHAKNADILALDWAVVDESGDHYDINIVTTCRAKTFGGWLVRTINDGNEVTSQVFIPDANHEWKIQ